MTDFIIIIIPL